MQTNGLHSATLARAAAAGIIALGWVLSGCTGVPTRGETAARRQAESAAAEYRPGGHRPALPPLTEDSGLSNYLAYAMLNQPSVEAAYYDWTASVERITQARSFPDPQFAFQMDIQNAVTSVMPGLMGSIPWPDKLRVAALAASEESRAKYFAFRAAALRTAFDLKRAYYQLYFLDEKVRVSRETLRLLSDLEKLARTQNEVGKVTLQDVLRAQIEEERLRTDLANLEDSRSALAAQFKAALGMGGRDPAPPMPRRFESTTLDLAPDQLLETALSRSQRLRAMEAEVRAAEASIILARKGRLPDFSLGFMADARTSPTLYRLPGFPGTVTLPIWRDKIAAQIAEAQANKQSVQARLSAEQIGLAVDVAEKAFLYREATLRLRLLNERLLPKARQSLAVARSAYLAGQTDFFNLTDSERTLLGFEARQSGGGDTAGSRSGGTLAHRPGHDAGRRNCGGWFDSPLRWGGGARQNHRRRGHVTDSATRPNRLMLLFVQNLRRTVPSFGEAMALLGIAVGLGAMLSLAGCSPSGPPVGSVPAKEKTLYTCGMHPQVVQDHPGDCPICGMKLTPIRKPAEGSQVGATAPSGERKVKYYKSTMMPGKARQTPGKDSMGVDMVPVYEEQAAATESSAIAIDPVTTQNMGIRTATGGARPATPGDSHGGGHQLQRDDAGRRDHEIQRLDREARRERHRPVGDEGRPVVRDLFTRALQRATRVFAGCRAGGQRGRCRGVEGHSAGEAEVPGRLGRTDRGP